MCLILCLSTNTLLARAKKRQSPLRFRRNLGFTGIWEPLVCRRPAGLRPRCGAVQGSCGGGPFVTKVSTRLRASARSNASPIGPGLDIASAPKCYRPCLAADVCTWVFCHEVRIHSSRPMKRNDPPETQEAGERENGHAALRNSHAPAFRGGMRDSASGTQ